MCKYHNLNCVQPQFFNENSSCVQTPDESLNAVIHFPENDVITSETGGIAHRIVTVYYPGYVVLIISGNTMNITGC